MSSGEAINSSDAENLCVVCFKTVEIFSLGVCDHAVCYECSTRMRVLCRQNECPICRQDLPKVIFTKKPEPFSDLFPRFEKSNLQDRKFGLIFCTYEIQNAYQDLLNHYCTICDKTGRRWVFKTFVQLKDHMRKAHELQYCDICSENLKIFSFERRAYTRQELAMHRRKGDPDNTSHRGHPLCEFCDTRYMDSDELFRHLRRHHLFCHFCDADGKHQYYNSMEDLKKHFNDEHYLCEEGECKMMPLTAVFRTDIDLKAHITTEHSRYMSKSANKQARTLELEFTLAPRGRGENSRNNRRDRDRFDLEGAVGYNVEPGGPGGGPEPQTRTFVNPLTSNDFPALGNATNNIILHTRPTTTVNFTSKINPFSREEFPSLGGGPARPSSAVTITTNSASISSRAPEVTITRTVRSGQRPAKTSQNFPALGGGSSSSGSTGASTVRLSVNSNNQDLKAPKVSIEVNHKSNGAITTHITTGTSNQQKPTEAFPALGKTTEVVHPKWVQQKSKKQEPKVSKVAPPPTLPPSDLSSFPSLSKSKSSGKVKKSSSVTVPVSNNWMNDFGTDNSSGDHSQSSKLKSASSGPKLKQTTTNSSSNSSNNNNSIQESNDSKNKSKKKKSKNNNNEPSALEINNKNNKKVVEDRKPSESTTSGDKSKNNNDNNTPHQNGLVKKRSELKIGNLSLKENVTTNDFPALGTSKPPPGFTVKPPPGFSNNVGVSNDLTFTNSTGQSYSITPSSQNYKQPPNFETRNRNLIQKIMSVTHDNDKMMQFKSHSDKFRKGTMTAQKYYEHCRDILGGYFEEVFPELLVLLPDLERQQELLSVHSGESRKNMVGCEKCGQVIFRRELTEHYKYHTLDNHFPTLGKATQVHSAWKK